MTNPADDNRLVYQIEAVKNETTRTLDVKITNTKTQETDVLAAGGYDAALFFERALEEVLGEEGVRKLYRNNHRPLVSREDYRRIIAAHSCSNDH